MSERILPVAEVLRTRGTFHSLDIDDSFGASGPTVAEVLDGFDGMFLEDPDDLYEDFRAEGINRTPVFIDETGLLRDGYHRVAILADLQLPNVLVSDYQDGEFEKYFGGE